MEWKGMIVACDKCGKEVRLKYLGKKEVNCGITQYDTYEPIPDSWEYNYKIGYLCPNCKEKYYELLKEFMQK